MLGHFVRLVALMLVILPASAQALLLEPMAGIDAPARLIGELATHCVAEPAGPAEHAASPPQDADFKPLTTFLQRGYTSEICWLRFDLQRIRGAPAAWLLEVGIPILDSVVLYIPDPSMSSATGFTEIRMGDRLPYAEWPVPHRNFVFPLQLPEDEPVRLYLRIKTTSTLMVDTVNVWQYPGLLSQAQRDGALFWGVCGFITFVALLNLVFWFWLRERVYGLYAFYLTTLFLLTQSTGGLLAQWLLPNQALAADRMMGVAISMTYLAGLLLFDEIFGLRRQFRHFRRLFPVLATVYCLTATAAAFGHYEKMVNIQQVVALMMVAGVMLAGPWLIWQGVPNLRLYTLAFSTQLIMAVAIVGRNLGLWASTMPLDDILLATTAVHVVLLNFILANRVRRTEQQRMEVEKSAAILESEQLALDQQREFMSMVAHEFRTPLAIIDASAQRMAMNLDNTGDKLLERCSNIRTAVKRLTALMDEFLTIDRMEGHIRPFASRACHIDEVINTVTREFPSERIEIRRPPGLPEKLTCDPALLHIALCNLLKNALRFSPPDGRIILSIAKNQNGLAFSVADSGPGIPEDELPKLFQKYFRGRNSQSQPGAGLGLFLVDQISRLHNGSISVRSDPQRGSCFVLRIPEY